LSLGNTRQGSTQPNIHPRQNPFGTGTGQTSQVWAARDELHLWVNSNNQDSRSPNSLHDFKRNFGECWNTSWVISEGPKWRTKERGSEWKPIKILLEGDGDSNKMNTTSNTRLWLNYQSWSRPRSHWSATGPRNQHTAFRTKIDEHTQWKLAQLAACATPVRPMACVGQTGGRSRSGQWLQQPHNKRSREPQWLL
jgi:hypothetical protein